MNVDDRHYDKATLEKNRSPTQMTIADDEPNAPPAPVLQELRDLRQATGDRHTKRIARRAIDRIIELENTIRRFKLLAEVLVDQVSKDG